MRADDFPVLVAQSWSRAVFQASHELEAYRPQLLAALANGDAEVRSAAVAALYEADDVRSHDAIAALIDDPVTAVREEVAEYLGEFATDDDIPRLVGRLDDEHIRFQITKALCRLTGWSDGLLNGDEPREVVHAVVVRWKEIAVVRGRDASG